MLDHDDPTLSDGVVVGPKESVPGTLDLGHSPRVEDVRAAASGNAVLVRCGSAAGAEVTVAESIADIAVYAWLGVRVFATPHPAQARQALDMVASVRGERPPAVARRGLA